MSHFHMVKGPKPHTHSVWLYWGVFFALVFLTALTVFLAQFDFGKYNILVTLLIAGTKATLVMSIFMHLAFDNKFLAVIIAASFVFLSLFIIFPILDLGSREEVDEIRANFLPRDEKVHQHNADNPNELPLRPGLKKAEPKEINFSSPGHH